MKRFLSLFVIPFAFLISACTPQEIATYMNIKNDEARIARADNEFIVEQGPNNTCHVTSVETKPWERTDYIDGVPFTYTLILPVFEGESFDLCNSAFRAAIVFTEDGITCLAFDATGTLVSYTGTPLERYNYRCPDVYTPLL